MRPRLILLLTALGPALAGPGCARDGRETLTVLTCWPEADQRAAEALVPDVRVRWVRVSPGRVEEALARGLRADVALGGPVAEYERLAARGRVARTASGLPSWRVVRLSPTRPGDPRSDPAALAGLRGALDRPSWAEGYARLVREGAGAPPSTPSEWPEAGAVVTGTGREKAAREFLAELAWASGRPTAPAATPEDVRADALLAELLGATLIDADPDRVAAWRAVGKDGSPERWTRWLTEAPPWPPASVARIVAERKLARDDPGPWLDTLATQIAPDPIVRGWLVQSWDAPPRPIDAEVLRGLARAADGRLADEPRFRAWLRAEWTAWARQRYRRVERGASGAWPGPAMAGAGP